jgi:hypothetical protein
MAAGDKRKGGYCRRAAKLAAAFASIRRIIMAKSQQRSNKEAKKPKKDNSPPKPPGTGVEPVRTITTAVIPRGKLKNK